MNIRFVRTLLVATSAFAAFAMPLRSSAQYVQIANQISSLVQPALSGSLRYRGFVEALGLAGMGENRANFLGVSTTQGFQYASWFYMGAGLGVNVVMANDGNGDTPEVQRPEWFDRPSTTTKCMIPVFTDFRFTFGPKDSNISAYIGLKFGAAWLLGNSYLRLQNGRMSGTTQFYFRPAIGARFAVNKDKPAQALSVALTYQLLTSNNNWDYYGRNDVSLHALGLTIGYEFGL